MSCRTSSFYGRAPLQGLVRDFHDKFGVPVLHEPAVPVPERIALRQRLIREEYDELLTAMGVNQYGAQVQDANLPDVADAIGDLLYVVMGTALEFGIDMGPVIEEIHRSNMAKLGPDGKPIVDEHGKVRKPPGWAPPDIAAVLRRQGWEP